MRFRIETWTIAQLVNAHSQENLILNPPYQRNFIWSLKDQRILIESIEKNYPIPNIFLKENEPGRFEVVDGQQRTRTIIAFKEGAFTDFENRQFSANDYPDFDDFQIAVIIIMDLASDDISIEEFYGLVNSAGVHLNRPEIKKAEFYDTRFLELINYCNDYPQFKELGLFTDTVLKRMSDVDFVSELIVLLKDGITDKKESVDRTFEHDITQPQFDELRSRFTAAIDQLYRLDRLFAIKKTRYKQRNDFYTLFNFIEQHQFSNSYLNAVYETLILIGSDISPSNDECLPFQTYARNCVTQSNSKSARLERLGFMDSLFLNHERAANHVQRDVFHYYQIDESELIELDGYYMINISRLKAIKPSIIFSA